MRSLNHLVQLTSVVVSLSMAATASAYDWPTTEEMRQHYRAAQTEARPFAAIRPGSRKGIRS